MQIPCLNQAVALAHLQARQGVYYSYPLPDRSMWINIDAQFLGRSMRLILEGNRHSI
jgi:hypothetical protein